MYLLIVCATVIGGDLSGSGLGHAVWLWKPGNPMNALFRTVCAISSALLALTVALAAPSTFRDAYNEALALRPLPDGSIEATFTFNIETTASEADSPNVQGSGSSHFRLFPLSLAQLLNQYSVNELDLSITSGQHIHSESWDPKLIVTSNGAGLLAKMNSSGSVSTRERYSGLRNGLAGLFCASLADLGERFTVSPKHTFARTASESIFYSAFPAESMCTENITPFIKLLPCNSRAGVSSLLDAHSMLNAEWHSMRVQYSRSPRPSLVLTFRAIMAVDRGSEISKKDWSLTALFGHDLNRICTLADESWITVAVPYGEPYYINPEPTATASPDNITYNMRQVQVPLNLQMNWKDPAVHYESARGSTGIHSGITRLLEGAHSKGTLVLKVANPASEVMVYTWMETLPWFMLVFLHSMRSYVNGTLSDNLVSVLDYQPSKGSLPTLLESKLHVPPYSKVEIRLELLKSSILYTEHPPDASRGWEIPPAVIVLAGESEHSTIGGTVADLPVPDFSMPYNVIIMTSTLVALFFGSIFNILTRPHAWVKIED